MNANNLRHLAHVCEWLAKIAELEESQRLNQGLPFVTLECGGNRVLVPYEFIHKALRAALSTTRVGRDL